MKKTNLLFLMSLVASLQAAHAQQVTPAAPVVVNPPTENTESIPIINQKPTSKRIYTAAKAVDHLHLEEITKFAQDSQAGQITIQRGDSISIIARSYAKANGISFGDALNGLIAANPDAFEDAQHNLKLGVALSLPVKADMLVAGVAKNSETPSVSEITMPISVEPKPVAAEVEKSQVPATTVSNEGSSSLLKTWFLWAVGGLVFLLLLSFIRSFLLKNKQQRELPKTILGAQVVDLTEEIPLKAEQTVESVAFLAQPVSIMEEPQPTKFESIEELQMISEYSESQQANINVVKPLKIIQPKTLNNDEDDFSVDESLPNQITQSSTERFNKALGGLSALSLDLGSIEEELQQAPADDQVSTQQHYSKYLSPDRSKTVFSQNLFKTPSQRWRNIGFNVSDQAVEIAQAKAEAMNAVRVPPEVLIEETAATPTLSMDVPEFLNHFSHQIPEPTYTSVDYEDLLEPARLRAWLDANTPEQILLYAQDAHDANYDDVAALMLNEVFDRGNVEQQNAVKTLRYLWSYRVVES